MGRLADRPLVARRSIADADPAQPQLLEQQLVPAGLLDARLQGIEGPSELLLAYPPRGREAEQDVVVLDHALVEHVLDGSRAVEVLPVVGRQVAPLVLQEPPSHPEVVVLEELFSVVGLRVVRRAEDRQAAL